MTGSRDPSIHATDLERDLATLARQGDMDAFDGLVRRHLARARRIAMRLMGHAEDADDLVQDAFLRALERIGTFDPARPFGPWFTRILVNLGLDQLRKRITRQTESRDMELVAGTERTDAEAERVDFDSSLGQALAALPGRQGTIVTMFEIDGYNTGEIAEMLGVSQVTIRWHLHRARQALREILKGWAT